VEVVESPGVLTYGRTPEEALERAKTLLAWVLADGNECDEFAPTTEN
jgi:predicted RNase H-like HicB family nuclease